MALTFHKFAAHGSELDAVKRSSQRLLGLLHELEAMVKAAAKDAGGLGEADDKTSNTTAGHTANLVELIQLVEREARDMVAQSEALSRNLTDTVARIAVLEHSLEQVRCDAATDGLTGLPNRRGFEVRLRDLVSEATTSGAPLCLLLVDIDHFKRINDICGHQFGDEVLRLVAASLDTGLRPDDFLARFGGDEFAVIMPATDPTEGKSVAERVRYKLEGRQLAIRKSGRTIDGVTLSVGGACHEPNQVLDEWIERADMALYAAKRSGRNRVQMVEDLGICEGRAGTELEAISADASCCTSGPSSVMDGSVASRPSEQQAVGNLRAVGP